MFPHQNNVDAFYGNPRGRNGQPSSTFERENLVIVPTPWKLFTSWDKGRMRGVRIHKKCAES
jgi:hypothetical protein